MLQVAVDINAKSTEGVDGSGGARCRSVGVAEGVVVGRGGCERVVEDDGGGAVVEHMCRGQREYRAHESFSKREHLKALSPEPAY